RKRGGTKGLQALKDQLKRGENFELVGAEEVVSCDEELHQLHTRIGARFARAQQRQCVLAYLKELFSPLERKCGRLLRPLEKASPRYAAAALQCLVGHGCRV